MNNEFNLPRSILKEIALVKRAGIQKDYYPKLVEILIELKYSVKQEIAIQRQKDRKPLEFQVYDEYCEECKTEAKRILGIE